MMRGIAILGMLAALAPRADAGNLPMTMETSTQTGGGYWIAKIRAPRFEGDSRLVTYLNRAIGDLATAAVNDFRVAVAESTADTGKPENPYEIEISTTISVATERWVSLYFTEYTYTGGAHGMTSFRPLNVAVKAGLPHDVTLEELLTPPDDAVTIASDLLLATLKRNPKADFVRDGSVTKFEEVTVRRFILTPSGVAWLLEPYEAAPYAVGPLVAKVSFQELGGRLNRRGALAEVL